MPNAIATPTANAPDTAFIEVIRFGICFFISFVFKSFLYAKIAKLTEIGELFAKYRTMQLHSLSPSEEVSNQKGGCACMPAQPQAY